MNYKIHHFTQAHRTKAYNDQICKELRKNNIREKILKEHIQRDDYENNNMYCFMKLLKQPKGLCQNRFNEEIIID